jgi:hypothetical protein
MHESSVRDLWFSHRRFLDVVGELLQDEVRFRSEAHVGDQSEDAVEMQVTPGSRGISGSGWSLPGGNNKASRGLFCYGGTPVDGHRYS